jgi:hypothetical protein
MNNVKFVFLKDKGPSFRLSCDTIWFHQKFRWLVIYNQCELIMLSITPKWQNHLNIKDTFPFIWTICCLHFVIWLTNICHYKLLTIIFKLGKHNPQPLNIQINVQPKGSSCIGCHKMGIKVGPCCQLLKSLFLCFTPCVLLINFCQLD